MDKLILSKLALLSKYRRVGEIVLVILLTVLITSYIIVSYSSNYTTSPTYYLSNIHAQIGTNINVHFDEDENKTARFLDSTPLNVIDREIPEYIPNLGSPCFYERIGLRFYKHSKAVPRPGFKLRCLPRIILAGFCKSGTTDLHYHIIQHQHIYGGAFKESHFWGQSAVSRKNHRLTMGHYTDLFSHSTSLIESCCLSHLFHHEAHVRCAVSREISQEMKGRLPGRKNNAIRRKGNRIAQEMKESIRENELDGMNSTDCPIMIMDSTPRYVWEAHHWMKDPANINSNTPDVITPNKIHHVIPNAKIIIIMRRPEDRLWSDYHFFNSDLNKIKNADHFHDCVSQGIKWWNKCMDKYSLENCAYGLEYENLKDARTGQTWEEEGADRVRISIYYAYVLRWLQVFGRENTLFIRFEDYVKDPIHYVKDYVYPFLGLGEISEYGYEQMQASSDDNPHLSQKKTRNRSMHDKTRQMLQEFYQPYNEKLADLLQDERFLWSD